MIAKKWLPWSSYIDPGGTMAPYPTIDALLQAVEEEGMFKVVQRTDSTSFIINMHILWDAFGRPGLDQAMPFRLYDTATEPDGLTDVEREMVAGLTRFRDDLAKAEMLSRLETLEQRLAALPAPQAEVAAKCATEPAFWAETTTPPTKDVPGFIKVGKDFIPMVWSSANRTATTVDDEGEYRKDEIELFLLPTRSHTVTLRYDLKV